MSDLVHPFPGNVLMHVEGMGTDSQDMPDPSRETRTVLSDDQIDYATVVTSTADCPGRFGSAPLHRPVLDLDFDVRVVPSSTPGHHHLYIDRFLRWDQYLALLEALATAGIVQHGFVKGARDRGHTAVRVPWVRKGDTVPVLPPEVRAEHVAQQLVQAARAVVLGAGSPESLAVLAEALKKVA